MRDKRGRAGERVAMKLSKNIVHPTDDDLDRLDPISTAMICCWVKGEGGP